MESGNLGDATWETPIVVFDGAMEPLKIGILHGSDGDDRERVSEKRREWELRLRHWRVFEASERERERWRKRRKGKGWGVSFSDANLPFFLLCQVLCCVVNCDVCDLIFLFPSSASSDASLSTKFHTPTTSVSKQFMNFLPQLYHVSATVIHFHFCLNRNCFSLIK